MGIPQRATRIPVIAVPMQVSQAKGLVCTGGLIACCYDKWSQTSEGLGKPHEWMSEQLGRREPPVNVHLQTMVKEVLKHRRQFVPLLYLRFTVCCYQIQRLYQHQQHSSVTSTTTVPQIIRQHKLSATVALTLV